MRSNLHYKHNANKTNNIAVIFHATDFCAGQRFCPQNGGYLNFTLLLG
jgi:hypothetical protein